MKRILLWVVVMAVVGSAAVWAGSKIDLNQSGGGTTELGGTGPAGFVSLYTLLSGEDTTNNVLRVENQFSRGISTGADVAIKNGAGLLHSVTCFSDAAATAGDLAIRDATAAGAGTIIMENWYTAVAVSSSTQVVDIPFTTGLYADYTTTNDVTCVFVYR